MDVEKENKDIFEFYKNCDVFINPKCDDVLGGDLRIFFPFYPDDEEITCVKLDMGKIPFNFILYLDQKILGLVSEVYTIKLENGNRERVRIYIDFHHDFHIVREYFGMDDGIAIRDISDLSFVECGLTKSCVT